MVTGNIPPFDLIKNEHFLPAIEQGKPSVHQKPQHLTGEKGELACGADRDRPFYRRNSCVTWTRLPQVSLSWAILEAVTSVGGMVNSAPRAFRRS